MRRRRRRYPWAQIANMALASPGVWRLHSSLVAVDNNLLQHARRRVRALRPREDGIFAFATGAVGQDDLGRRIFDLYVRFEPKGLTLD